MLFGGNIQENFAYNEVMNGNQVESQIVYKVENGKFLQNHLKYNFTYDAQGRTIQKEALKWNEIEQAFERFYCLNYNYTEAGTDVEYALWDNKMNAYSDVKEKAVYLQAGDDINYLSYKWSKKGQRLESVGGTCHCRGRRIAPGSEINEEQI